MTYLPHNGAAVDDRIKRLRELPARVEALAAGHVAAPTHVPDNPGTVRKAAGKLSGHTNRLFYAVVLGISLTGAGLAACGWLDWHAIFAFPAVAAVEFGGVALSVHAEERRRKGERAVVARILSALVAVGAVAVNWFGHADHTGQASFFAGMSALGYTVWLIDSGARRRDALRADGKLDETTPFYGLEWVRHPWLTRRARTLALVDPTLGRQGSLAAARAEVKAERRQAAIAAVLHKQIAKKFDATRAEVLVHTYDLDEIARLVAAAADYEALARMISAELTPDRVDPLAPSPEAPDWRAALAQVELPALTAAEVSAPSTPELPAAPTAGSSGPRPTGTSARKPGGSRGRKKAPEHRPRRSAEEHRKLAAEHLAAHPGATQDEIAAALGISTRQLRNVLNTPTIPKELS